MSWTVMAAVWTFAATVWGLRMAINIIERERWLAEATIVWISVMSAISAAMKAVS